MTAAALPSVSGQPDQESDQGGRVTDSRPAGYAHPGYAASFSTLARGFELPACGGQLLLRDIAGLPAVDASGSYPVFSCREPAALAEDVASLPQRLQQPLVTLTLVPDPLQDFSRPDLQAVFPIVRPLGEHYVVDLEAKPRKVSSHHRRKLRQAASSRVELRIETDPLAFLPHWIALYQVLIEQVRIRGIRRFSPEIFAGMLAVPGTVLFTAWDGDALLGADWYYQDGDRVYAHLSAYTAEGYVCSVSYPLMDAALGWFSTRARLLDIGGVPGVAASSSSGGLAHFKAGWSNQRRPAWLCGRDFDRKAYLQLSGGRKPSADEFFPHHRIHDYI